MPASHTPPLASSSDAVSPIPRRFDHSKSVGTLVIWPVVGAVLAETYSPSEFEIRPRPSEGSPVE
jgi:hypothetical protein